MEKASTPTKPPRCILSRPAAPCLPHKSSRLRLVAPRIAERLPSAVEADRRHPQTSSRLFLLLAVEQRTLIARRISPITAHLRLCSNRCRLLVKPCGFV